MGHPDRRVLREKRKRGREKMLARKSYLDVLDLTPFNAVGRMSGKKFEIRFK